MLKLYELNLKNIEYWKKTINMDSSKTVFVKDKIDSFTLFLDRLGNPKSMPKTDGSYFIDLVSGRVLSLLEEGDYIVIEPSGIRVEKANLKKDKQTLAKAVKVLNHSYDQYVSTSEDIEYNTYFCNKIALRESVDEIPLELVNQEIMNVIKGREESQNYVERFYESKFSSYDFMCLFTAISASQKKLIFNRDSLIRFIRSCKSNNQFSRLLDDIYLKSNGIFDYSNDLDEAIQKLKIAGILYTISPESDATMYIFENIPMSKLIKDRLDYFDEMANFVGNYEKYVSDMISQAHQRENRDIAVACKTLERLKK